MPDDTETNKEDEHKLNDLDNKLIEILKKHDNLESNISVFDEYWSHLAERRRLAAEMKER